VKDVSTFLCTLIHTGKICWCATQASDIKWASRWDTYLLMTDDQIHWFSIINSLMIVLFLTGMVAMIMMRTLRRDISQYNELESAEEAQEETGWKLVRNTCISNTAKCFPSPWYHTAYVQTLHKNLLFSTLLKSS
jgi:hypothetical protein